ncbi:hypothetical protein FE257_012369 [Aspergillus nanangensis]|uniref:Xylanolytic transcriptional activator regulatory domain-containing protein n=1 Tax=Aspergillus nanangensis TaxID=2582783 RepID=A0AAD4CGC3_ASPNN|nr:hypothetical protein FE257_012369 [Aspergillus nanangensis]
MESSDPTTRLSEIGSLRAHSNEESQFVGSSSGVYFINTVRQAFLKNQDQDFPPPEDTLVQASPWSGGEHALGGWDYDPTVAAVLGHAPPLETARDLMMVYFKVWHPLFPFLHGPSFLRAMELLYSGDHRQNHAPSPPTPDHRNACWTTIFQCIFNLASHLSSDVTLPPESHIKSSASMHALLGTLTCRNDIPSLQALLASQLYLVAKMSLRTASTVGGCMLRSMLHAGLHRCPFRYRELSTHDRQLRKRIFWSAYAIDRYLSQALGLPLGIQDSDIDVCFPGGHEAHIPGSCHTHPPHINWSSPASYLRDSPTTASPVTSIPPGPEPGMEHPHHPLPIPESQQQDQHKRQLAFASYVESGTLTGRALELFHKSIFVRSIRRSSVLVLITDVHKWWNSLSSDLQGSSGKLNPIHNSGNSTDDQPFNFGPFFTVLYQHLILLINRPSLSLAPSTPEFGSALQTCIGAAREILTALTAQAESGQALFWPGFLSAAWMAGLVLAFACQLRQYVLSKGYHFQDEAKGETNEIPLNNDNREINKCLDVLRIMSTQWETAKHCHRALSLLSHRVQQSSSSAAVSIPTSPLAPNTRHVVNDLDDPDNARKKRRLNPESSPIDDVAEIHSNYTSTAAVAGIDTGHGGPLPSPSAPRMQGSAPPNPILPSDPAPQGLFLPGDSATTSLMELDLNMVDLLQGANFDNLLDMFGQQYPSF